MATYPPSLAVWETKRDFIDPIWARHFNNVQEEVRAVELTLGINPQVAVDDPADRTPDYITVTNRVQKSARGEPMCSYRGLHIGAILEPNKYVRPTLTASEDTHGAATEVGYRLPETGYWVITAKVDWPSTPASVVNETTRVVSIEIDGVDIGVRESILETDANRDDMSTMITWQERLPKGTDISLTLSAVNLDPDKTTVPANIYLRAYLVRCFEQGAIVGLPNPEFKPTPPEPPPPPPPLPPVSSNVKPKPQPQPRAQSQSTIAVERFDGSYNVLYSLGGGMSHIQTFQTLTIGNPW